MSQKKSLPDQEKRLLITQGVISLVLLVTGLLLLQTLGARQDPTEIKAYNLMNRSLELISDYCKRYNINQHPELDPRLTGMIGPEWSEITTTTGDLEAKRSTVNPNFAVLVVRLLRQAGVEHGDTIAINCSGSFPALMVASISAAQSLNLVPRTILSIGSSSFGASNPDFTIADQYRLLQQAGMINYSPLAWSFGGETDSGEEFAPEVVSSIRSRMHGFGLSCLEETVLKSIVRERLQLFEGSNPGHLSAFINTGGSLASMGTSPLILKVKPGLIRRSRLPQRDEQGLIFAMLARDIPVIHLLYIKGLAKEYHLPWDPIKSPPYQASPAAPGWIILLLALLALIHFIWILIRFRLLKNRN